MLGDVKALSDTQTKERFVFSSALCRQIAIEVSCACVVQAANKWCVAPGLTAPWASGHCLTNATGTGWSPIAYSLPGSHLKASQQPSGMILHQDSEQDSRALQLQSSALQSKPGSQHNSKKKGILLSRA